MAELDTIRKERKKFICLNDNINHEKEGADMVREREREREIDVPLKLFIILCHTTTGKTDTFGFL